jgi:hypothetical protein
MLARITIRIQVCCQEYVRRIFHRPKFVGQILGNIVYMTYNKLLKYIFKLSFLLAVVLFI